MAIEDFGGVVLGKKIELLVADHQNKVDVGTASGANGTTRAASTPIFDITNSGVGLALQDLARLAPVIIFDSASSSDLTGKACSPNGIQWNADNWSNGVSLMRLLINQGRDTFFFITADYAFGLSLEADARDAIAKAGGSRVGGVRAPLNTADFSSYLMTAQASKAKVIVLANSGADLSTSLKQAGEFGSRPGNISQRRSPISATSTRSASPVAHDLVFMQSWYWDLNDKRAPGAKRFFARTKRMPNDNQAALYSSVRHYLEAIAKAGTDDAADRRQSMKAAPIHDVFTDNGMVRDDGRVVYDRYLVKVKRRRNRNIRGTICRSSRKSRPIRRFGRLARRLAPADSRSRG